ncbi:hypothetical protein [Pseudonocardia zijingensis]|jgi:hypothetical protein|uniref:Prenyltransferase n=1 Tax=Pseudonocardia zijingensis TaxID=153376 RepID=A0ABP4ASL4_9PSEU
MSIDLKAAESFLARHARLLDRRRYEFLIGAAPPEAVLAAVDGYRNPDGGYGWGLEPDLRAPESQPGGALHAFEVFAEIGPRTTPRAAQLCDWLETITLPDGGLPFAVPVADDSGCAPFWAQADPAVSTLHSTAFVTGVALRVAAHDRAVAGHRWTGRAVEYCLARIDALDAAPHAIELSFAVRFLDELAATRPDAADRIDRLRRFFPDDGIVPVAGGSPGEVLRPLDFSPLPGRPSRGLFRPEVVEAEVDRLESTQHDDGGWSVDFASYSPAAELEWRGYATVGAIATLRANGRLTRAAVAG